MSQAESSSKAWPQGLKQRACVSIAETAARLIRDARLLREHERHESSFALTVLALEEVGKLLIRVWGDRTSGDPPARHSAHIQKQLAVGALVSAAAVLKGTEFEETHANDPRVAREHIKRVLRETKYGPLLTVTLMGVLDKHKHLAFYWDDTSAIQAATSLDDEWVGLLMKLYEESLEALSDPGTLSMAKYLFEWMSSQRARESIAPFRGGTRGTR